MSNSTKIILALAFLTGLSLPASAAIPSSAADQGGSANLGISERIPAKVVEDTSKVQEPRVRVAPGCPSCGGWGW